MFRSSRACPERGPYFSMFTGKHSIPAGFLTSFSLGGKGSGGNHFAAWCPSRNNIWTQGCFQSKSRHGGICKIKKNKGLRRGVSRRLTLRVRKRAISGQTLPHSMHLSLNQANHPWAGISIYRYSSIEGVLQQGAHPPQRLENRMDFEKRTGRIPIHSCTIRSLPWNSPSPDT